MAAPQQLTDQQIWTREDKYHNSFLLKHDDGIEKAVANSAKNGLAEIAVSAAQGKFLALLTQSIKAKRILEVGTLGGYSAIWFARALPDDGELVTLELVESNAKVARENLEAAGVSSKVKILVGAAVDTLKTLPTEEKFDFVFIDADKPSNLKYFIEAKRLVRSGGIIIVDNIGREGKVGDASHQEPKVQGVRDLLAALKDDPDVEATSIATVGEKGYDGFLYSIRK
ncbi:hypothetical protein HGRIS_012256 [Hohenbuehelia grisea]|uniref:O-methyltransferase n=1 Tax=Hohenbuehelia grisea TaxID=104357 RepID=A0ABR3IRQ0_9AGAR